MTIPSNQIPNPGKVFFDHVAFFAPDMGEAESTLERLGFRLTPFTEQRNRAGDGFVPAGTGNRLAMLEEGYLEVLTPTGEDTPIARQFNDAVARYRGVHVIVFGEADAGAARSRLEVGGFQPLPTVDLQRTVETVNGEDTARFSVVRVPPGVMPEGRVQVCCHHTPDVLWQDRWLGHPNHVMAITDVLLCVTDPDEAAGRFARFAGLEAQSLPTEAWRLETARGALTFAAPDLTRKLLPGTEIPALPFIAAIGLKTADLGRTRDWLNGASVTTAEPADGVIVVGAADALGATIAFSGLCCSPPWSNAA